MGKPPAQSQNVQSDHFRAVWAQTTLSRPPWVSSTGSRSRLFEGHSDNEDLNESHEVSGIPHKS